jgi:uncharacterized repeat protein (TIGR03803 family)
MHSVETKSGAKLCSRISCIGPALRWRKPATVTIRSALTLAVLSATLLMAARPAHAQTEQVLYSFTGTTDGYRPTSSLTPDNSGNLYGTTYAGGLGFGTVFELSPNGSGGWTETTLYSFCPVAGCADGQNPMYSYVLATGSPDNLTLYGTAFGGGANGYGVVFELTNAGGTWTESVLHSFANAPDGANPGNGLIVDGSGNLYGMTFAGGTGNGKGCIFELSPSGGTWTEKVIYDITSTHSGLTLDSSGTIYGTTYGTIFELKQNGSGVWVPTVLFTFNPANSATQGSNPVGTLALDPNVSGVLYGTALTGGANNAGVVFKLTAAQTGPWTETLLYSFGGNAQFGPNGATPFAGVVLDLSGNIYGTTQAGGLKGAGTVYELSPVGTKGAYKEHVVFNFNGTNGASPKSSLTMDKFGYLYGTTYGGGAHASGTVFEANAHAAITKTTLTSSPNPSTSGEPVTFTVTVTSSAGPPPDGELVLIDKIAKPALVGGVATFTTKKLPVGSTQTSATYYGDINFTPSASPKLLQQVNP